ncbi:hypothetical protein CFN16_03230 [Pseudomonas fluorescens]|uniref:Uncharacterized protein n=1 Tax=Pseudomonas fluorescens TaxID=294 RepID=A0A345URR8_PSEFL|nr:hypothetical protein [Pseudomonas fluorescens]AXJ03170.1 hypothetical protein CFN16_03230 [Pseudomonas fluorescens]
MSEIDLKLMEASMEHHVQLSLDFQSVAERSNDLTDTVQPIPGTFHRSFQLVPQKSSSNIVMLASRKSMTVSRNSDLIGRILKSVCFYG